MFAAHNSLATTWVTNTLKFRSFHWNGRQVWYVSNQQSVWVIRFIANGSHFKEGMGSSRQNPARLSSVGSYRIIQSHASKINCDLQGFRHFSCNTLLIWEELPEFLCHDAVLRNQWFFTQWDKICLMKWKTSICLIANTIWWPFINFQMRQSRI